MKFFKQAFFFMASVVLLTACDNTHHVDAVLFSLDSPTGYLAEPAESSDIVSAVSISSMNGNNAIITFGALYQESPEAFLTIQTQENLSTSIPGLNVGTPYNTTIAGTKALVADCDGETDGEHISGKLYAFYKEPLTFVVLAFGTKGTPDVTEKVIASITPNKEHLDTLLSSPDAEIDMIVALAQDNANEYREEDITFNIHADHAKRLFIYSLSLSGTADNYADLPGNIATDHQASIENLRSSYRSDPALLVPLSHGYSIVYEYRLSDTGDIIATETFTPEEIM